MQLQSHINQLKTTLSAHPKRTAVFAVVLLLVLWFILFLPRPLFTDPTATVLEDEKQHLLGAKIAADGQWRFPERKLVPLKYALCLIQFEDRNYAEHAGVDVTGIMRAASQNMSKGKIVSGGSTITMQLARMARKNQPRNFWNKLIEMIWAVRIEFTHDKEEILALYASHAPFGGNVVGIDAASWRYFGRSPENLSWAEAATLAVLPNSPSLIYPGKNQERLKTKRDRLLQHMADEGIISLETAHLAMQEPLPGAPYPLPRLAPHLLDRCRKEGNEGKRITTTLDKNLQEQVTEAVQRHAERLSGNQIHNAAALVLRVEDGATLAYVGNTANEFNEYSNQVDVINAPRSTGSILKPMLYASMLTEGEILPNTIVPDIPTDLSGYNPENFNRAYDGAVPASRALARSLNVPAVRMLQSHTVNRFYERLKNCGMTTLFRTPDEYGLSLILGGAEGKLWDIAGMYASMARSLNRYNATRTQTKSDFHPPHYITQKSKSIEGKLNDHSWLDPAATWFTFDALTEVNRPEEDANWSKFSTSSRIAWKTGTSFGFRDGWAVGVTPKYVIAVWVGNATGEGRPGLTGIQTAAPILFDIFSMLRSPDWFEKPEQLMKQVRVCAQSGMRALDLCEGQKQWIPEAGLKSGACKYHRTVHLDASLKYRVSSDCASPSEMQHVSWFVLPPAMEYYYRVKNPLYKVLPPYLSGCTHQSSSYMEFVYPREETRLSLPTELDGRPGKIIFEIAHRSPTATVHWHLDEEFVGSTTGIHQLALNPSEGQHRVTCVDDNGETIMTKIEIVPSRNR